jgi:hypothetical protein
MDKEIKSQPDLMYIPNHYEQKPFLILAEYPTKEIFFGVDWGYGESSICQVKSMPEKKKKS